MCGPGQAELNGPDVGDAAVPELLVELAYACWRALRIVRMDVAV